MIIPELKLIFIGRSKCASVAIEDYLLARLGVLPQGAHWRSIPSEHDKYLIGGKEDRQHWKFERLKAHLNTDLSDWTIFSVKRSPVSRAISEFTYMTSKDVKAYPTDFNDAVNSRKLWNMAWKGHALSQQRMTRGASLDKEFDIDDLSSTFVPWVDSIFGNTSKVKFKDKNAVSSSDISCSSESEKMIRRVWWDDFNPDASWFPIRPDDEAAAKTAISDGSVCISDPRRVLQLIIKSRRNIWQESDWEEFQNLVERNISSIVECESWRWIVSISETIAERDPDPRSRTLANIPTVITIFEKMYAAKHSLKSFKQISRNSPDITRNLSSRIHGNSLANDLIQVVLSRLSENPEGLLGWYSSWNSNVAPNNLFNLRE